MNTNIKKQQHYAGLFKKQRKQTNETCFSLKDLFSKKKENRLSHQMFLSTWKGTYSHNPQRC